jgi:formylglycine-generating enzyme required for sulfatase activity
MHRLMQFATVVAALSVLMLSGLAQSADTSGVDVVLKASEAADAPVAETVQLYGASHALVIGINQYTEGWPYLSNAVKDAELVASELRRHGFKVKLRTNLKSDALKRTLEEFFVIDGADAETRLFVWFAGHGFTDKGEGFLVPSDAPKPEAGPQFRLKALSLRRFGEFVRLANAKHAFSVFDSCFSGTIFQVQRSSPPAAVTWHTALPVRQFLSSGDANEEVSDDGRFRKLFVRALRGEEKADANSDGYLTGSELGMFLGDRLVNLTNSAQRPRYGKLRDENWDQGDFVFVLPKKDPPEPKPAPSALSSVDIVFWQSIQNSTDASDFEAYLQQFADGAFVSLARNRLKALKVQKETQVASLPPPPVVPPRPTFEVDDFTGTFVALKTANLRKEPTTGSAKVGLLKTDTDVSVTGKVKGRNWFRIAYADGTAFVFSPLVKAIDGDELAAWNAAKGSKEMKDLEAFLRDHPGGYYAGRAKKRLEALRPTEPEPVSKPVPFQPLLLQAAVRPVPVPTPLARLTKPAVGVFHRRGDTFRDCAECPEMVVIPPGRFRMGDMNDSGHEEEKPVHAVNIGYKFAVGRFEVTFAQWDACASAGGCNGYRPKDRGWGRGNRPVIYVSWKEAKAYVKWLSRRTGKTYRLLTDSEWEYVARAGSSTRYPWGNSIDSSKANYSKNFGHTAPVGQYAANAFGVHDTVGNVWEWTEDCVHDNYRGAPTDGKAWTTGGNCDRRVMRGGSWNYAALDARSASNYRGHTRVRNLDIGFRVARTF